MKPMILRLKMNHSIGIHYPGYAQSRKLDCQPDLRLMRFMAAIRPCIIVQTGFLQMRAEGRATRLA
ncbi:MAG: hypothetical protein DPW21_03450 [Anaerolineae bacterium]|nr:hypothetical protein [Anaerolineae bacterium]